MPIDPRVEKFFADAGMHVEKMIARKVDNKYGHLTDGQIMAGAEALYHQIKGGRQVKRIQYASKVWQLARDLQGKAYDDDIELIHDAKDRIARINRNRVRERVIYIVAIAISGLSWFLAEFWQEIMTLCDK